MSRAVPMCPMLMQAAATGLLTQGHDIDVSLHDAIRVPQCIGSRCAWWSSYPHDRSKGRCDKARNTVPWPDPAASKEERR